MDELTEQILKQQSMIEELDAHYTQTTLVLEEQVEELEKMINQLQEDTNAQASQPKTPTKQTTPRTQKTFTTPRSRAKV